jgi:hypothetical protein
MATTKRTSVPGEADKLIAHQSRLLKAPRIAAHYARLAEQGPCHRLVVGGLPGCGVDGGIQCPR